VILMGERIEIKIDVSEADRELERLNDKVKETDEKLKEASENVDTQQDKIDTTEEQLVDMIETVDKKTEESEKEVITMMQDSYEKQSQLVEDVKEEAVRSFNEVMTYMRASYLMISGVSRILGGEMSHAFSLMYSVGVSAIGTYKAIAAAMATTGPAGWIQASLMMISLTTATSSLMAILAGQRELSTQIRGINMSLHGISAIIGSGSYFL